MKIKLLTITHKCPNWIEEGYQAYCQRMPAHCKLELVEIPAEKRSDNADIARVTARESEKMLTFIEPDDHVIALEITGKEWSTPMLAKQLAAWQQNGKNIALLVGGPEGLGEACRQRANQQWSLSPLTFPHFLVRLLIAEQLYRAYTILTNHPYHR